MALELVVNYVAVLTAAVVGMIIGFLWFGPLFGKKWLKLMKWSKEEIKKAKEKGMTKGMVIGFLAALVFSFVLAMLINATGASTASEGAMLGFWVWLGFVATVLLNSVLWENKPVDLYILNAGHQLVVLLVMGAILAGWP